MWMMEIEESVDGDVAVENEREKRNLPGSGRSETKEMIPEWNRVKLSAMDCRLHQRMIWAQCKSVLLVKHGSYTL